MAGSVLWELLPLDEQVISTTSGGKFNSCGFFFFFLMRADLPTGIAEASAQSLIKTTWFRALWMCNSPFWGLERKWCYKLLWNALIWGFFMCCPQRAWETRLWPECQGCSSAALDNLQVGQLRKVLSLPFHEPDLWVHRVDWAYSEVEGRWEGWDGTGEASANLQMLSLHWKTWRYNVRGWELCHQRHLGSTSELPTY